MKWKYEEMYAPAPKQKNDDAYSGKLTTFYAKKKRSKDKESHQGSCRIYYMAHLKKNIMNKLK